MKITDIKWVTTEKAEDWIIQQAISFESLLFCCCKRETFHTERQFRVEDRGDPTQFRASKAFTEMLLGSEVRGRQAAGIPPEKCDINFNTLKYEV